MAKKKSGKTAAAPTTAATTAKAAKRRKAGGSHLPSCDDAECTGCDVGEVDIQLVSSAKAKPNSKAAVKGSRRDGKHLSEQDVDEATHESIVAKLFELAVAAFDAELTAMGGSLPPVPLPGARQPPRTNAKAKASAASPAKRKADDLLDASDAESKEKQAQLQQVRHNYAACLLDFGRFLRYETHLRQALALLNECLPGWEQISTSPLASKDAGNAETPASPVEDAVTAGWCLLGRTKAAIAETAFYAAEQDAEEDDDDNDSEDAVPQKPATKDEKDLVQGVIAAFANAVGRQTSLAGAAAKDTGLAPVHRVAAKTLVGLAGQQRLHHREGAFVLETLKAARTHIDAYLALIGDAPADASRADMDHVHATYHFHAASVQQHSADEKVLAAALVSIKQAVELFKAAVARDGDSASAAVYQLLGESAILWSSLELDDDDAALAAFDEASVALQKAYELDPENEGLRQQLVDLELIPAEDDDADNDNDDE
ncbi:hypothetical protein BC831DRAFT_463587 [Entophlyctis helioformis]|nr:hypothetical protein BC831DRAFT_463587 [Entophlyctis helioformis]